MLLCLTSTGHHKSYRPYYLTTSEPYNTTWLPNAAFQPPEALQHRWPDTVDTFADYKYRNACNISSLDLHLPFAPLCADRRSMLTAMSSGGRIGHDAPYMPRGCDMRWFLTGEICEILSRFEKVIILGDSMLRHVIGSINVLIRKDLGYGAVTDWNFSPEERYDAFTQTMLYGALIKHKTRLLLQSSIQRQVLLCAGYLQDSGCSDERQRQPGMPC